MIGSQGETMLHPKIRRCLAAVALGFIVCVSPLRAGEPKAASVGTPSFQALPPLADWWEEIYGPIENALSRRETMVQFGAVGVLIGLFIIWYRRP